MKVLIGNNDGGFRISGTYAHGELEENAGYDIISFENISARNFKPDEFTKPEPREGIFDCSYNDIPCKFYLWKRGGFEWGGLCVYEKDLRSRMYALECYVTKKMLI